MKTLLLLAALICIPSLAQQPAAPTSPAVLSAEDLQKLVPATVYFSGQSATVQLRNSGGVRWADARHTLFTLVDTGGYSTSVRERYQFYILSDVAIEIAGTRLPAGAYGAGFIDRLGLIVMDIGGNEVFHAPTTQDAQWKRPRPLQVVGQGTPGAYRLYLGRSYVDFRQAR